MDNLSLTILCITGIFTLTTLGFVILSVIQIFKGQRKFQGNGISGAITFVISLVLIAGCAYCIYKIPDILFDNYTWHMLDAIGPSTAIVAAFSLAGFIPVFYMFFLVSHYFIIPSEKPFYFLTTLSIMGGIGSSITVFVINNALDRDNAFSSGLYIYFLLGISLFIACTMLVRRRLITITNDLVFEKRMEITQKVLKASYDKIESLDDGKIHAALNNDTETVSSFANIMISCLTAAINILCCLIYLGFLNLFGMLASIVVICVAATMFNFAAKSANKLWEKSRDVQNIFFRFINDLISGFKELHIHMKKQDEFKDDMRSSCDEYRKTRILGEFKFVKVTVIGEVLFNTVIGAAVFIFPVIFSDLQDSTLRDYVVVYLYMSASVNIILNAIPQVVRALISWKRINAFITEINSMESEDMPTREEQINSGVTICLKDVAYEYKSDKGEHFAVGPINCEFKSGEVVFITGGNGSGKSTLAKLVTGLYKPDGGSILINGSEVTPKELGSYFTTIFGNFHLFDKLYGVSYEEKIEDMLKYLKVLRMDEKVQINNGVFSTTKLSTGQRKRLALMVSYAEDRPVCLFDEWAADQDPEFRRFFYMDLLPELKARGKCIIAITHDDRYFDTADKMLKLETGKIVYLKDRDNQDFSGQVVNASA
jgi:putative pyoverdin transport system ATP-binding/permease protein